MENMGKHEYVESMNVKTWMFFRFRKKAFTHTDKKKEKKPLTDPDFLLHYGKQTFFVCLSYDELSTPFEGWSSSILH